MTEEDLAYAHLCRAGEERQIIIARDAAMNGDLLNAARLHRGGDKIQRRLDIDGAMIEEEISSDHF